MRRPQARATETLTTRRKGIADPRRYWRDGDRAPDQAGIHEDSMMIPHSRQLPHRVTTRHLGAAYPFMAEAGFGARGVQLGVNLFGGPFLYGPWELSAPALLTNPKTLVIGQSRGGKTAHAAAY